MADRSDAEVIAALAGGARIRIDQSNMGGLVVQDICEISVTQINRLVMEGKIETLPSCMAYKLSDEGLKEYLRSTDELRRAETP